MRPEGAFFRAQIRRGAPIQQTASSPPRVAMKLSTRIILGFSLLLGFLFALGGLALWRMHQASGLADDLAEAEIPAVLAASKVERTMRAAMYEIRGYTFSGQESYLQLSEPRMAEALQSIEQARAQGAADPRLEKLEAAAATAQAEAQRYDALFRRSVALVQQRAQLRESMNTTAATFVGEAEAFSRTQSRLLEEQLQGAEAAGSRWLPCATALRKSPR